MSREYFETMKIVVVIDVTIIHVTYLIENIPNIKICMIRVCAFDCFIQQFQNFID